MLAIIFILGAVKDMSCLELSTLVKIDAIHKINNLDGLGYRNVDER